MIKNTRTISTLLPYLKQALNGRNYSAKSSNENVKGSMKVSVIGAMGELGQPLTLMLRTSEWFSEVALYDIKHTKGLSMELNDIDIPCRVDSYNGHKGLIDCLKGAKIVVICASANGNSTPERKFKENARIVADLSRETATHCPEACFCLVTSPVNCLLPIACEIYKKVKRCVNPCKMFGVVNFDVMKASTVLAEVLQLSPESVYVPVIGGHSAETTVPVFSHSRPCISLTQAEICAITEHLLRDGDDVTYNKEVLGGASLSAALSTSRFITNVAKALQGHPDIVECAYVMSNVISGAQYLTSQIRLGPNGVAHNYGLPQLSDYECCLLQQAIPYLRCDIAKGEAFVGEMIKNGMI